MRSCDGGGGGGVGGHRANTANILRIYPAGKNICALRTENRTDRRARPAGDHLRTWRDRRSRAEAKLLIHIRSPDRKSRSRASRGRGAVRRNSASARYASSGKVGGSVPVAPTRQALSRREGLLPWSGVEAIAGGEHIGTYSQTSDAPFCPDFLTAQQTAPASHRLHKMAPLSSGSCVSAFKTFVRSAHGADNNRPSTFCARGQPQPFQQGAYGV